MRRTLTPQEGMNLADYLSGLYKPTRKAEALYKGWARLIKNSKGIKFNSPRDGNASQVEFIPSVGGFYYIYWHYIPNQNKKVVALKTFFKYCA
jgi:hypothetical protein